MERLDMLHRAKRRAHDEVDANAGLTDSRYAELRELHDEEEAVAKLAAWILLEALETVEDEE